MNHVAAFRPDPEPHDESREELLDGVATLRRAVASMAGDLRAVMRENTQLRDQIASLRRGCSAEPTGEEWMSEAQRIKREVAQLVQMHERAHQRRRPRAAVPRAGGGDRGDRAALREMMVAMMMADMA